MMDDQTPVRVMIVDDHVMVREGLKVLLSTADDVHVVGEAATGDEAIRLVPVLEPDVVLMDIMMPVVNGADATAVIRRDHPSVQVVALTNYADADLVEQTLAAGAVSYLLKDSRPETLVQAIRDARVGRGTIDSSAMHSVMERQQSAVGADLTLRERDVLKLLAAGLSNREIAEELTLSVGTVRLHVSSILTKLDAPNRTTAAIMAVKHGLA